MDRNICFDCEIQEPFYFHAYQIDFDSGVHESEGRK